MQTRKRAQYLWTWRQSVVPNRVPQDFGRVRSPIGDTHLFYFTATFGATFTATFIATFTATFSATFIATFSATFTATFTVNFTATFAVNFTATLSNSVDESYPQRGLKPFSNNMAEQCGETWR